MKHLETFLLWWQHNLGYAFSLAETITLLILLSSFRKLPLSCLQMGGQKTMWKVSWGCRECTKGKEGWRRLWKDESTHGDLCMADLLRLKARVSDGGGRKPERINKQWWNVIIYIYSNTVLMYILEVLLLYVSIYKKNSTPLHLRQITYFLFKSTFNYLK